MIFPFGSFSFHGEVSLNKLGYFHFHFAIYIQQDLLGEIGTALREETVEADRRTDTVICKGCFKH